LPPVAARAPIAFPLARVRNRTLSVAPESTARMPKRLLPETVTVWPVPSIVRVLAISGRVLPRVIVPLTLKLIVSVPVPGAQSPPVVSDLALALLIASRRVQNLLPEVLAGSVVLSTVMVLLACSADWLRRI